MIFGFTGTRAGMTDAQKAEVRHLLTGGGTAHHGDCIGADAEFHHICLDLGIPVTIHPPRNAKHRAFCTGAQEVRPTKPYLERNQAIVTECEILIAAPRENTEPPPRQGQGTWSTIRYARTIGRTIYLATPLAAQRRLTG